MVINMGYTSWRGKPELSAQEVGRLKALAKEGIASRAEIRDLKQKLKSALHDAKVWKERYQKLQEQTKDLLEAVKRAPVRVMELVRSILHTEPEKEEKRPHAREEQER